MTAATTFVWTSHPPEVGRKVRSSSGGHGGEPGECWQEVSLSGLKDCVSEAGLVIRNRLWRIDSVMYRVPLVFTPQPEGGYTVTSPVLPELLTDGDTLDEAHANVQDAFDAVAELYAEQGRQLPPSITLPAPAEVIWAETLIGAR